jgi:hypothetical protein
LDTFHCYSTSAVFNTQYGLMCSLRYEEISARETSVGKILKLWRNLLNAIRWMIKKEVGKYYV